MATGTPRRPRPKESGVRATVDLSYPGKRSLTEILDTPASRVEVIRGGSPQKRLYFGDNLRILAGLVNDRDVVGKIRLVYIDPPYSTQTVFHSRKLGKAYEDVFDTVEYLEFMRARIAFLHRVLADDGSLYLHIDSKMLFHVKLVLDEVFGPHNFRNCITRKKCNPKNYTRKAYGNVSDFILFYSKSENYVWNRLTEPWNDERAKEYQYIEEKTGRRYMKVPIHAPGTRNGATGKPWRGISPPLGKHWQFTPATLEEMDARGEIFWSKNGNPRRKVYLDQSTGVPVQDIWLDFRDAHNQNIEITGYPTEKNLDLIKRIVQASSNPGDLVLDCFAGSGTTLVAADMLGRSWIGIDNSLEALRTIVNRFANGSEPMGDFVSANKADDAPATLSLFQDEATPVAAARRRIYRVADYTIQSDATEVEAVLTALAETTPQLEPVD